MYILVLRATQHNTTQRNAVRGPAQHELALRTALRINLHTTPPYPSLPANPQPSNHLMLTRFFTKNVTRHLWQDATGNLSYSKRMDYFKTHLASSLTYLQECHERYKKLVCLSFNFSRHYRCSFLSFPFLQDPPCFRSYTA